MSDKDADVGGAIYCAPTHGTSDRGDGCSEPLAQQVPVAPHSGHEADSTELATRLAELWGAERCDWTVRFESGSYGNAPTWVLTLTWTDEHAYTHGADWVTYDWQFYGDDFMEALTGAVEWCEALSEMRGEDG